MQKISTYLYPNRISLLADLASFTVEFTNVYQRPIKIYKGIDNVIEFDVKNADQKRIELVTTPEITNLKLYVSDALGKNIKSGPTPYYAIAPVIGKKGIATAIIPAADLAALDSQNLKYTVVCSKGAAPTVLYGDTRFDAFGILELVGNVVPFQNQPTRVYDTFTAEIDLKGFPTFHSSAIPTKFYEAVPTETVSVAVHVRGYTGSIWVEGTKKSTINTEAFKGAAFIRSYTFDDFTGVWSPEPITIGDYQYIRVSYASPLANGIGANFVVKRENGAYQVTIRAGGTGYAVGSKMKVIGSLLGGTDGIHDLTLTVTSVDGASTGYISSYSQSTTTGVSWTGVAESGTGTYIVSGTNIAGTVDKVVVS